MTSDRRFERDLPDLLAQLAPRQVPDYRDDVVRQTARVRQRPAWTFPERWLPMDIALAPARGRPRSFATLALFALVGLLIAALLVAFVGSRPAPIPAPFGPAANGALFYDADGAIMAMDTVTSTPRSIISGSDTYTYPLVSRDGRLITFDHTTATGLSTLYVANADGSNQHPLAGTYRDWTWTEWSTDSTTVGIVSTVDGARAITMLPADGSAATTLPIGQEILTFWFLADGRIAFTGSDGPGTICRPDEPPNHPSYSCGLFVANADGTGVERIIAAADFSSASTSPSPDGRSILYVRFTDEEPGGIHVVDMQTKVDRRIAGETIPSDVMAVNNAWFSPDGSHILFDWFGVSDDHWGVVPVSGGSAIQVGQAWPARRNGAAPEAAYSPDGTSIFAWYPRADGPAELWLLDPSGGGKDQQLTTPTTYLPVWQRTAP